MKYDDLKAVFGSKKGKILMILFVFLSLLLLVFNIFDKAPSIFSRASEPAPVNSNKIEIESKDSSKIEINNINQGNEIHQNN